MPLDALPPAVVTAQVAPDEARTAEVYGPVLEPETTETAAGECEQGGEEEIVVCAETESDEQFRYGAEIPDPPPIAEQMGEALNVKLGPVELGSIRLRDGSRAFGLRIRF